MRKVEDKVSKKNGDGFQQLDCLEKDTILEWAARYEIQNNEPLYQSILQLRNYGGTLAMKTFWGYVRNRTVVYNQIFDCEINKKVTLYRIVVVLYTILIIGFLFLFL